ncbi:TolC family protein [Candidatus Binatus sp.]|uniref:TolC family protein n=1 Tax=Candidatus Binatus sp. TaxID=2811406 RepID=UPI003CC5A0C4
MKKLHTASRTDALLNAISSIRRIASAAPPLWPLAMVLYLPAIPRLAVAVANLSGRALARATIILTRVRMAEIHTRDTAVVAKGSRNFRPLHAGLAELFALVVAGLMATKIPLVYAQAQPVPANAAAGNPTGSIGAQNSAPPVNVSVSSQAAHKFETNPILSLPDMLARQWTPGREDLARDYFPLIEDNQQQKLSLKETIYLALQNNPGLQSVSLDPVAATESVKSANAVFDPQLSSQIDVEKESTPVSSPFQNPNSITNAQKLYDWNFGISKVLSTSNATLGVTFNNDRELTNSGFSPVNPVYTPTMVMSLSQPLLQNFGWQFATINVRLAESAQRSSQWNYASSVNDFVQRIGNDYWGVVQAEENLQVAQSALKFNNELVRVNRENVRLGMMAAVNLAEALSAAATARANVSAAKAGLEIARTTLRQDVAANHAGAMLAAEIEPLQQPDTRYGPIEPDNDAFKQMLEYSPALAGLREAIRSALIQVKYAENQTLPQLNLGVQFGVTSEAGNSKCTTSGTVPAFANCFSSSGPTVPPGTNNGALLPFGGDYGTALNGLFDFKFYDYAAVLGFSMPLDNAAPKAALAQAHVAYDQSRLQYRQALYQAVLLVKSALANLTAFQEQVDATAEATTYAQKSLHDTEAQYRVGTATTNTLLQFQSNLVTAQGNQVQADVGLENARLALWHAEGTLLGQFNIDFQVQNPRQSPWYSRF